MVSFECDYNNGMLPQILSRLAETNEEKVSGYGYDRFTAAAKERIRKAVGNPDADVFLLTGGTQTNATVIDALLLGCEGVVCTDSAHIAVHESGAVEAYGHKVIALPSADGKLYADMLAAYMDRFRADDTAPHQVQPAMAYITMPTEYGLLYSRTELSTLYDTCRRYGLHLYIDGARLGYGLMADTCDYDLKFLASNCDVFYIGGTKAGAMMGEAVVFSGIKAPRHFFTTVKRHGALLAKGRMLGLQFDTLFKDDLYFRVSRHAVEMAMRIKAAFVLTGIPLAFDSPTNQQFVRLSRAQHEFLSSKVLYEVWGPGDGDTLTCRFVTSWATTEEDVSTLEQALQQLPQ